MEHHAAMASMHKLMWGAPIHMPLCHTYENTQLAEIRGVRTEPPLLAPVPKTVEQLQELPPPSQAHTICALAAIVYGFRDIPDLLREDPIYWVQRAASIPRNTPWLDTELTAVLLDLCMWAGTRELVPLYDHLLRLALSVPFPAKEPHVSIRRSGVRFCTLGEKDPSNARFLNALRASDAHAPALLRPDDFIRKVVSTCRSLGSQPYVGKPLFSNLHLDGAKAGKVDLDSSSMSALRGLRIALHGKAATSTRPVAPRACKVCKDAIHYAWDDAEGIYMAQDAVRMHGAVVHKACSSWLESHS